MSHHHRKRADIAIVFILLPFFLLAVFVWFMTVELKPRRHVERPQGNVIVAQEPPPAPVEATPTIPDSSAATQDDEINSAPELRGAVNLPPEVPQDDAGPVAVRRARADLDHDAGIVRHHRHRSRYRAAVRMVAPADKPDFPAWMTPGLFQ